MEKRDYNKVIVELKRALADGFRGFLAEGTERIEVPDDKYHLEIALKELLKIPGWQHESGVGENPITEYMKLKRAIYITSIGEDGKKGDLQKTVGYLINKYEDNVIYHNTIKPMYEVLRDIVTTDQHGYDVDEYKIVPRTPENNVKTPVSVTPYPNKKIKPKTNAKYKMKDGDIPVFAKRNGVETFIGVMVQGTRFISKENVERYQSINPKDYDEPKTSPADPGEDR